MVLVSCLIGFADWPFSWWMFNWMERKTKSLRNEPDKVVGAPQGKFLRLLPTVEYQLRTRRHQTTDEWWCLIALTASEIRLSLDLASNLIESNRQLGLTTFKRSALSNSSSNFTSLNTLVAVDSMMTSYTDIYRSFQGWRGSTSHQCLDKIALFIETSKRDSWRLLCLFMDVTANNMALVWFCLLCGRLLTRLRLHEVIIYALLAASLSRLSAFHCINPVSSPVRSCVTIVTTLCYSIAGNELPASQPAFC